MVAITYLYALKYEMARIFRLEGVSLWYKLALCCVGFFAVTGYRCGQLFPASEGPIVKTTVKIELPDRCVCANTVFTIVTHTCLDLACAVQGTPFNRNPCCCHPSMCLCRT